MDGQCTACKVGMLEEVQVERECLLGESMYQGVVTGWKCGQCSEVLIANEELTRFDAAFGRLLARGKPNGKAFAFLRKIIGLKRSTVAYIFKISYGTVVTWETETKPVNWMAFALMGRMFLEWEQGLKSIQNHLKELRNLEGGVEPGVIEPDVLVCGRNLAACIFVFGDEAALTVKPVSNEDFKTRTVTGRSKNFARIRCIVDLLVVVGLEDLGPAVLGVIQDEAHELHQPGVGVGPAGWALGLAAASAAGA